MAKNKTYLVSYTETAYWTIEVEATSEEEAIEKAEQIHDGDNANLDWGGITDNFFQVEGEM